MVVATKSRGKPPSSSYFLWDIHSVSSLFNLLTEVQTHTLGLLYTSYHIQAGTSQVRYNFENQETRVRVSVPIRQSQVMCWKINMQARKSYLRKRSKPTNQQTNKQSLINTRLTINSLQKLKAFNQTWSRKSNLHGMKVIFFFFFLLCSKKVEKFE